MAYRAAVITALLALLLGAPAAAQTSSPESPPLVQHGPVQAGETLWSIARQYQPWKQGCTIPQLALAILRANPQAFSAGDTRAQPGVTLQIPAIEQALATSALDAHAYFFAPRPPSAVAASAGGAAALFRDSDAGRAMLAQSKSQPPAQTYEQLAALETEYAGDFEYDYLLGTSALDSGHYSRSVLALQRVVLVQPGYSGARLELARAYFSAGDNESARREFQVVRNERPTADVAAVIDKYLSAIDRRALDYRQQRMAFVELVGGMDSNANGSSDLNEFIGITLDARNQAQESPYYGLAGGGLLSHPTTPSLRLIGNAMASHKAFPDASFVDASVARLGAGAEVDAGAWTLSALASGQNLWLDGENNHRLLALDLSAGHPLTDHWRATINARVGQLRFQEALAIQDVDSLLGGVVVNGRWLALPRAFFGLALTAGVDNAVPEGMVHFGRNLVGARLLCLLDLAPQWQGFVSVAGLESDYDGQFIVQQGRKDTQATGALGLEWRPAGPLWSLRSQAVYVDNQSDVPIYQYDRLDVGITVRREFR